MTISPIVRQHRWMGHYRPVPQPHRVHPSSKAALLRSLKTPLHSLGALQRFVNQASRVLPSLQGVSTVLQASPPRLSIATINRPELRYTDDGPELILPSVRKPVTYFGELVECAAGLLAVPEGIELPPLVRMRDASAMRARVHEHLWWRRALQKTLRFQMLVELESARMTPEQMAGYTMVTACDLALFEALREGGLTQMAELLPRCSHVASDTTFHAAAEYLLDRLRSETCQGAEDEPWLPPDQGQRLEWPLTMLDTRLDQMTPYRHGLYVRTRDPASLPDVRIGEMYGTLQQPISRVRDIQILLELIQELAPALAMKLMAPLQAGAVELFLAEEGIDPLPVYIDGIAAGPLRMYNPYAVFQIFVVQGSTVAQVLPYFVMNLARATAPDRIYKNMSLRGESLDRMMAMLEQIYVLNEMWGYTGLFEFVHEANQRGLGVSYMDAHQTMRDILADCGLFVLSERWEEFADARQIMKNRAYWAGLAGQLRLSMS